MDEDLKKEFDFYVQNQKELVKKYNGKFIVIKNQKVIEVYDSEAEAYQKAQEKNDLGTFLIQKCSSGEESYTQTFHSRILVWLCPSRFLEMAN